VAIINAILYCGICVAMTGLMNVVDDPSLRFSRCMELFGIIIFSSMVRSRSGHEDNITTATSMTVNQMTCVNEWDWKSHSALQAVSSSTSHHY